MKKTYGIIALLIIVPIIAWAITFAVISGNDNEKPEWPSSEFAQAEGLAIKADIDEAVETKDCAYLVALASGVPHIEVAPGQQQGLLNQVVDYLEWAVEEADCE